MLSKEKIERINFLARKKRENGLTPGELKEQHNLRQEYLSAVRGQVRSTLDSTKFVDEKGNEIPVNHKYRHKNCGCSCGSDHKHHHHNHNSKHLH